jgi:DNA-binding NarL/FixJ family response regulator
MLVDDHEVVREGLKALLNRRPNISVVAEAGSVAQAIEVAATSADVIMDVRLPTVAVSRPVEIK